MIDETESETAEPVYSISLSNLFLRDEDETERQARLKYHIETGDYFNLVATIVGFLEDSLKQRCAEDPELESKEIKLAQDLREDLQVLNRTYCIKPKENSAP